MAFEQVFSSLPLKSPPHRWKELKNLWTIARETLPYVYLGNVPGGSSTFCPRCGEEVIERAGYSVNNRLKDGNCPKCNHGIFGEGMIETKKHP